MRLRRRSIDTPTILYLIFTVYVALQTCYRNDLAAIPQLRKIENIPLNCTSVVNGTEDSRQIERMKQWTFDFESIEFELKNTTDFCETVDKYFNFARNATSIEEEEYPLAYGLVVYKELVQVILQLSLFYQPQHLFCIKIDVLADPLFKRALMNLHECFPNINVFYGAKSEWGTFGILENVYSCFYYLATQNHPWKYYQYLSGSDVPMRTNLEMVRIFKAMGGLFNTDIEEFEYNRKFRRETILPPVPLFKSSMSVAVPRAAADYMISSRRVEKLYKYLRKTWIPDESFWTSVAGSPAIVPVPGAIKAKDIVLFRRNFKLQAPIINTVKHVGLNYIARYQVWQWQNKCRGVLTHASCVFGVDDVAEMVTRPELVAHKFYLSYQPAALICMELRRRSSHPLAHEFDASSYSEMPTVEMAQGRSVMEVTHPDWLIPTSFYNPDLDPGDYSKFV
ncbi:unnamed protein product [Caenorhabditis bovis]|uniref:Uncharacterized protein n=1 Tax=Caenorhabditis bovis TaxID=2654633 RepID=A0A8S1F2X0_9PELO|nr:unnamed protein product [Caenorhabditis bovis]